MRYLYILIAIAALNTFTNCNDGNKKSIEDSKASTAMPVIKTVVPVTKYVLVVIKANIPDLNTVLVDINKEKRERQNREYEIHKKYEEGMRNLGTVVDNMVPEVLLEVYRNQYTPIDHFYRYTSEVFTAENFKEDDKYRISDQYEERILKALAAEDQRSFILTLYEYQRKSKILEKKDFVFDTYAEASKYKDGLTN